MGSSESNSVRPVIGANLRRLVRLVFILTALLAINSLYLLTVTAIEAAADIDYQGYFFLVMFLLHLLLGLALIPPLIAFGLLHMRNAWRRPNRYAIRAGGALYFTALLVVFSGLLLSRFDFFEVNDPGMRNLTYWVHLTTPLIAAWLFVLHRLAGRPIRWRAAGYWGFAGICLVLGMIVMHVWQRPMDEVSSLAYEPALSAVRNGPVIPQEQLLGDQECAVCHADIAAQAASSMHRLSSFNNPAYRFSVEDTRKILLQRDGDIKVARLCASCHDQVPLFSGRFDDPAYDPDQDPGGHAGITCIGCHGITAINSPQGNGAYTIGAPPRYPFAFSDKPLLKAINHQLIKAKPGLHKKAFLKPIHREALFCSSCHKVHLPYALNHYRWLRGQDHYDSFLLSGVSGHRVDSFYYPPQAIPNCAHCHMPLVNSDDPAARDFNRSGQRSVHNHLFPAANTAVPHMLELADGGNEMRRGMLRNAARVDIFGLRAGGEIDGELFAPLRPKTPTLKPGERYLLETVVRTLNIGHQLTQGTTDSNELWLEVELTAGGRRIGQSGKLDANGEVDPWSYFLNSYLLDRHGNRIERRNAQDIFVALYDHQIPPGAAAVVHYAFELPPDTQGPVTAEVKLQYRKFDSRFLKHIRGSNGQPNDLPITTLASDRIQLPLAANTTAPPQHGIAAWERWNDYGIGLLRQGRKGSSKGALRQAETAFQQVERLMPAQGALNLARGYFKEGRLEETMQALQRAAHAEPPAPAWTLAWYSALVDRAYGNLESALEKLRALAATNYRSARERGFDFSQDIRVLNEIGRNLYDRSRQERGAQRREQRLTLLREARDWLQKALRVDPEYAPSHNNLVLVESGLGDSEAANRHRQLHEQYRRDDQALEQAVSRHRQRNPAANHAAEPIAIYDLQRSIEPLTKSGAEIVFRTHLPSG